MILNVESFSLLGDIFNVNQIPDPLPTHTAASICYRRNSFIYVRYPTGNQNLSRTSYLVGSGHLSLTSLLSTWCLNLTISSIILSFCNSFFGVLLSRSVQFLPMIREAKTGPWVILWATQMWIPQLTRRVFYEVVKNIYISYSLSAAWNVEVKHMFPLPQK